jgi:hypothetical protein
VLFFYARNVGTPSGIDHTCPSVNSLRMQCLLNCEAETSERSSAELSPHHESNDGGKYQFKTAGSSNFGRDPIKFRELTCDEPDATPGVRLPETGAKHVVPVDEVTTIPQASIQPIRDVRTASRVGIQLLFRLRSVRMFRLG